jgi:histidinol dehydrogenase
VIKTWEVELPKELEDLRRQLSLTETLLPDKLKDTHLRAFSRVLSPIEAVRHILSEVKQRGDEAVLFYGSIFDGIYIPQDKLKLSDGDIEEAYEKVSPSFLKALKKTKENITAFQRHIKLKAPKDLSSDGKRLELLYRPIEKVGIYVPGGRASYASTVLMCAVPAREAGVEKIVMTTPPGRNGQVSPERLVAAREAGVDEVYRVGGVQAIGAMAFGTQTIPKVDKLVGPGNPFVTLAKKEVYGHVDIDMLAGPSEVVIIADDSTGPSLIAADLLSQAEHPGSAILITPCEGVVREVMEELERQLKALPEMTPAQESLDTFGLIIITRDLEEAIEASNLIAPEHVELLVKEAEATFNRLRHAGSIFLGENSPVAVGDYMAGPSHVLPTGGTARFFSGLTVNDFLKRLAVVSYDKEALQEVAQEIITLAETEGLPAHAQSVRMRLK